jgi:hypothetical protein
MANYKKLENLVKDFETLTDDILNEIVNCPDVDVSTLTDREKFACLVFQQMSKALENKSYKLMLDCNYPQSNKHNKSEKQLAKGQSPQWLVDYYRLVSKEGKQKSLIQIYVSANPKSGTCKFNLCTSCAKDNLAQFIALRDELQFEPVGKKGGDGAKTTQRTGIDYDDLVSVCKAVTAILSNTEKARAEAKKNTEEADEENTEE